MPWRGPSYEGEFPSLGHEVVAWIERYLCHGPGDVQGTPIEVDDEFYAFVVRAYRLDEDTGRRVYRRAFLSRAKGRAKSELAGMLACAEALGPVRFAGWDAEGEPVGKAVTDPFIRLLATEEGQSGNTYDNVTTMLDHLRQHDGDAFPSIDLGRSTQTSTRIFLAGGGEIVPSTASGAAKDGGKETFAVFDEPVDITTPVPTPTGWSTMGALHAGDTVFGVDGQPVLVWGVAPIKYDRPCYRVTFDDGTSMVTDESHRWRVYDRASLHRWDEWTTGQMANANHYGKMRFAVAQPDALDTDATDLPIDPYVLGYWLGDGTTTTGQITVGRIDLDSVRSEFERLGWTTNVCDHDPGKAPRLTAYGLQAQLRHLGVLGNKHVPERYLWASTEQRLALLAGLLDSDGYANERGNCVFTSTSRALADAVVHLVRSLGWRATAGHWQSDDRWNHNAGSWRVSFTPSGFVPFRLKRKADRCRVERAESTRGVRAVERVPSVPVRCIAVDSDDHLFLVGESMLPTHNTHLYRLPELHRMHATVRRNLRKRMAAEPWGLETSTMYAPGEESVAEATHAYAQSITEGKARETGLLFDHRQAPPDTDLSNRDSLVEGLRAAYGPFAEHMDLDGICAEIWDPQSDPNESRRYWLNQPTAASDAWLQPHHVEAVTDAETVVADGDAITLGFDGSRKREHRVTDSTALVGCRVSDGHLFLLPFGDGLTCWEQPQGPTGYDWEVPTDQVADAVAMAFDRYKVVGFYADPARWESYVDDWTAKYGPRLLTRSTRRQPIQWWITGGRSAQVVEATSRLHSSIVDGECSIDTAATPLIRHLINSRRRTTTSGIQIAKDHPTSPRKIDAAVAAILAWRARGDAIAAGYGGLKQRRTRKAVGF